jgi:glycosyltransferase involved in cell wall biosynthesis
MKILFLFTGSYPFPGAKEDTFLTQEIVVLRHYFDQIYICPFDCRGKPIKVEFDNVKVVLDYFRFKKNKLRIIMCAIKAAFSVRVMNEARSLAKFNVVSAMRGLLIAIGYATFSDLTSKWLRVFLAREKVGPADVYLYTWWFNYITNGLLELAAKNGLQVLSRAHGYDLYERRRNPPVIPFRECSMSKIKVVVTDSVAGAIYLRDKYPTHANKVVVGLLGTQDPGFINPTPTDDCFRIVSCSVLVKVKRIDYIINGISAFAVRHPALKLEWIHFGDGPEKRHLETLAEKVMPVNVKWSMPGYPGLEQLLSYYRDHSINTFINASESEGTPVSIIEALSVGIPIIATKVGGNIEAVGKENGLLIPLTEDPDILYSAIDALYLNKAGQKSLRAGSRLCWEKNYQACNNYDTFAEILMGLHSTPPPFTGHSA